MAGRREGSGALTSSSWRPRRRPLPLMSNDASGETKGPGPEAEIRVLRSGGWGLLRRDV
jgi:hypothetical protein